MNDDNDDDLDWKDVAFPEDEREGQDGVVLSKPTRILLVARECHNYFLDNGAGEG